ncbi:hypothetical protein AB0K18_42405 [Nonomuraea sp. NPDC049421]|uniref:hypothetical protein n=1 Tax=Nonomuraea sp. NPDC049421 TaxID=3155275 RepID=UPI003434CB0F
MVAQLDSLHTAGSLHPKDLRPLLTALQGLRDGNFRTWLELPDGSPAFIAGYGAAHDALRETVKDPADRVGAKQSAFEAVPTVRGRG